MERTFRLTNCRIFDGLSEDVRAGELLVEDGVIREVAPGPLRSEARAIDAGGRVVMPGLIDAHVHVYATTAQIGALAHIPPVLHAHQTRPILEAMLQRGFTTVRDVAGADAGIAAAVETGLIEGPRVIFGGKALSVTGGHGDAREAYSPCGCDHGVINEVVDGVDAARRAVRARFREGAHHIKIMASGGVASPTDPIWGDQYSDEEMRAIVWEANARRSYVTAHAYTAAAIARALACGVRCFEHGNLIDAPTAMAVAKAGAYIVPTLVTYEALATWGAEALPPSGIEKLQVVRANGLRAIEICRSAGVKLGFGTDLLGAMHAWQSREFGIRAEVEKPIDILRSATSMNAEIVQRSGDLGIIKEGARADLLVVEGDPLTDVSILTTPETSLVAIVKDGRFIRNRL